MPRRNVITKRGVTLIRTIGGYSAKVRDQTWLFRKIDNKLFKSYKWEVQKQGNGVLTRCRTLESCVEQVLESVERESK